MQPEMFFIETTVHKIKAVVVFIWKFPFFPYDAFAVSSENLAIIKSKYKHSILFSNINDDDLNID